MDIYIYISTQQWPWHNEHNSPHKKLSYCIGTNSGCLRPASGMLIFFDCIQANHADCLLIPQENLLHRNWRHESVRSYADADPGEPTNSFGRIALQISNLMNIRKSMACGQGLTQSSCVESRLKRAASSNSYKHIAKARATPASCRLSKLTSNHRIPFLY